MLSFSLLASFFFYLLERENFKTKPIQLFVLICFGALASLIGNSIRITSLIAIGTLGDPDWALGNFHSYTGVLLLLCLLSLFFIALNQLYSKKPVVGAIKSLVKNNIAAPYLLPFACLLFLSLFFKVFSPSWDWWYPLKILLAGYVVWFFKNDYKKLIQINFSWFPIFIGIIIAAIWIFIPFTHSPESNREAFLNSESYIKIIWISFKLLGPAY